MITLPVGVLLGVLAAYFRNSWIDATVTAIALVGVSVPGFWVAILSVILFSVKLGWVPSSGYAPLTTAGFVTCVLPLIHAAFVPSASQIGPLLPIASSS